MRSTTHSWRATLSALVLVAACRQQPSEPERPVSYTWKPPQAETIAGVPATAIAAALGKALDGAPPAGVEAGVWKNVKNLYKEYDRAPLWMESAGPIESRTDALLAALVEAPNDALRLDGYPIDALADAVRAVRVAKPPTAEQLAAADVLLSSAYLALAEDLLSGQTDPKQITTAWHISTRHEKLDSAVVESLKADDLAAGIARMRPQDAEYEALRQALVGLRATVAAGGWPQVPEGPKLGRGDTAPAARIAALRARLAAEGIDTAGGPIAAAARTVAATFAAAGDSARDSTASATPAAPAAPRKAARATYDRTLANAVATWQARHDIAADGILGAETVKAMNVSAEYRLGQVAASLERHRWMPRALGERYIYVNIPSFRLRAVDTERPPLEMKVIVGAEYEGRTTPVFADSMETVVFRPYWNVTPDIQSKEIVPAIQRDPGYLARNDMEWFDDYGTKRVRQRPGPKNSLGLVKFLFPNTYNIYLHDTPSRLLFLKDMRAFSHGCIRLEKPDELAQWVLGWDAARVEAAMEGAKNNVSVRLPKKIPVYITYLTAYMRDGELHFGNDLYSRDEKLIAAMADGVRAESATTRGLEALRQLAAE